MYTTILSSMQQFAACQRPSGNFLFHKLDQMTRFGGYDKSTSKGIVSKLKTVYLTLRKTEVVGVAVINFRVNRVEVSTVLAYLISRYGRIHRRWRIWEYQDSDSAEIWSNIQATFEHAYAPCLTSPDACVYRNNTYWITLTSTVTSLFCTLRIRNALNVHCVSKKFPPLNSL